MKKISIFLLSCLFSVSTFGQQSKETPNTSEPEPCGTPVPTQQWDEWFNKEVEKFKQNLQTGRAKMVNYTIPVIVHVIHYNNPVGTYPNISAAQVASQINAMNADFAGVGYNYTNCPAPFAGLIANTGIQFCLATTDPLGTALAEPGINRINAQGNGWVDPSTLGSPAAIQNFINNTVKPASIWDPTKYFNIWISSKATDSGLLGYATFPAGTSLTGIPGGFTGTATSDGVWCYSKIFGQLNGTLWATYDKGKVMSHEAGHWLGLRHMWGDGNCLTDFCNDTPWHKAATSGGACKTFPYLVNECGTGQSPNGRMFMNFMDYSDDDCMYMFTPDQTIRMQTAMSQGSFRNLLGTHGLCAGTQTAAPGPAVASFTILGNPCIGTAFSPSNTSTGGPVPSFTWSSFPPANFSPNAFAPSPGITFPSAGNYTITLIASNTVATSSYSMVVMSVTTCPKPPVCIDTLSGIKNIDTLTTYIAPSSSFALSCQSVPFRGFLTGTNCYGDREFAQFYPSGTYSDTPLPQVNSLIVLFNKKGTKATPTTSATQVYFKIYGGTDVNGPGSQIGIKGDSLGAIEAVTPTNQVQYCGKPTYVFTNTIVIPHVVNFAAPIIIPTSGFFASVQTPFNSPQDSIQIFSSTKTNLNNDSSAWVLLTSNNWRTMRNQRAAKIQLAILPQITCRPIVGVNEVSQFQSNINIMPNPSTGAFSLVFTLPKSEKISVKIYNYLGQELSNDQFNNVSNNVFDIDLSTQPNGVYFINISNGTEKTIKKIIVSH